jgi:DNA mismatch repair protein MutL
MPIHVLDPTVAAQIAAGEVVERPASVVKELVENALDAGARRITVGVRGGGIDELVIQDDGRGIPADEITTAFARHATSKLTTTDDLWAIQTLGFRGEALPSIAAVAQVICTSRTGDAATGAELRIAGGEVQALTSRGGAVGTTFTIRNLFYNVPVRREFLKSPAAEATAIAAVVIQYALAYPQIAFALVRDGKRIFQTSGRGQLADAILELYGVDVARQMIAVEGRAGEDLGAVHVQGMVSAPTLTRGARDGMHITVNGRAIQPRGQISSSIEDAYHTLLMKGRFPLVVLHLQVHPAAVDVNVHPTKSEVKFRQPLLVGRTIERAVRAAVQGTAVVQSWADPAAEQAAAHDVRAAPLATTHDDAGQIAPAEAAPMPSEWDAAGAAEGVPPAAALPPAPTSDLATAGPPPAPRPAAHLDSRLPDDMASGLHQPELGWSEPAGDAADRVVDTYPIGQRIERQSLDQAPPARHLRETPAGFSASEPQVAAPVPSADIPVAPQQPAPAQGLPPLRALAQLAQTYLLTEGPGGALYLIDQHAAHERITYERLLAQHGAGAIQSQALLLPHEVALPPHAQQALLAAHEELATWGFVLEESQGGVQVCAVPAGLVVEDMATTLADLASHLSGRRGQTPDDRRDATLATLACHTSVRAGQTLTPLEQQALIDQLAACQGPRTCPHGRPTLIVLTQHQLERQFGRLGA